MNLLITGAWSDGKSSIAEIEALGHTVCFMQYEKDEIPCPYEWIEGVVGNGLFLNHPIEKFTNLRYIQLTSAGYDRVDMDYIKAHNIMIHNARGVYSIPMAEFVVCGVLQLYKQAAFFRENQKRHLWEKHRGLLELADRTVCIIGCGSVGCECAKRFKSFDCKIIGVDPFPQENSLYNEIMSLDKFNEALTQADIVVLTLPLTEQTKHMINNSKLVQMKDGSVLVNIARGAIIDTNALLNHIDRLTGAVLDVHEEEPISEKSPLWDKENIILTPHNSFVGEGNTERLKAIILSNLRLCARD